MRVRGRPPRHSRLARCKAYHPKEGTRVPVPGSWTCEDVSQSARLSCPFELRLLVRPLPQYCRPSTAIAVLNYIQIVPAQAKGQRPGTIKGVSFGKHGHMIAHYV